MTSPKNARAHKPVQKTPAEQNRPLDATADRDQQRQQQHGNCIGKASNTKFAPASKGADEMLRSFLFGILTSGAERQDQMPEISQRQPSRIQIEEPHRVITIKVPGRLWNSINVSHVRQHPLAYYSPSSESLEGARDTGRVITVKFPKRICDRLFSGGQRAQAVQYKVKKSNGRRSGDRRAESQGQAWKGARGTF